MLELFADLRLAVRALARSRGLTAVIVLSLALGIGANTAIFSVANALFLKPLPYPEADRLTVLWLRSPGIGIPQDWPSPGQYIDIVTQNHPFSEVAISQGRNLTIAGLETPSASTDWPPVQTCFICSERSRFTDACCCRKTMCRASQRSPS
jgi:hypothetical protein